MTVVVDGHMTIQFFTKNAQGKLLKDGSPVTLKTGQTGYVAAGIHFCVVDHFILLHNIAKL